MAAFSNDRGNPSAFAIVAAAGESRRMGRDKTTLSWGDSTVIECVVQAMLSGGAREAIVVTRKDQTETAALARRAGALVVPISETTSDMKATVGVGLNYIRTRLEPRPVDCWLVAPADVPSLSPSVVAALIARHRPGDPKVLVPTRCGKRGHPLLLPWGWSHQLSLLSPRQGLRELIDLLPHAELACGDELVFDDIDTPAEYEAARTRLARGIPSPEC